MGEGGRTHYPRTAHLPWSPGAAPDDVRAGGLAGFAGREVVVTEKLDGENTTLYADGLHARSLDSAHHPSRAWVKALQGRIGARIPAGWRVCGENVYARHSLPYDELESYFYGFSVWDGRGGCLGWDETVTFLRGLGVPTPPVLWRGVFDERALRRLRVDTSRQEGYVVRTVDGFPGEEFGRRVAKWVRGGHVQTGTHWMHAAVTPNGLGPGAALWDVRSGAGPDAHALLAALGVAEGDAGAASEVGARVGGHGDVRLAGVLAGLLWREPRGTLPGRLAPALGLPLARRAADLVGLRGALQRPYPDDERRAGLVRMSYAVELDVLHAVAAATAPDEEAREQVEWSGLFAEEVGAGVTDGAFGDLEGDVAARCRGEARIAYAEGRISVPEEAVAATWRWRDGRFPRLVQLVGPSGSGKSAFARGLPGICAYVSLDGIREERGDRADQRANGDVLREGLARLDAALAGASTGGTVVWDATSLTPHQRSLVHAVARRRDALITHAVVLVDEDELLRRNAVREHRVPGDVLAAQLRRFVPPYPGQVHRTWYIGARETVEEEA
ncbi:AAA family ATPase [Streptomyces sp. MUM 203J]|uniref:RNA ligase family protein n=1 Tax=Streptomyces sp. MUM 203J TaxID=2791990 RepID=UPI001F041402|nr:RNA ligase family protein [Streptomyces sp. MUM 203J]MCH0541134.1 AAA family ATPase [Streptomyces sp. MUM 203J]